MAIGLVVIQSVAFPNVFLRMDGGSGTVNCQYYEQPGGLYQFNYPIPDIGNDEVFELIPLAEIEGGYGGYEIRSLSSPQAFLRIDGSNVTQYDVAGSGTVNCQYYSPGSYPQYYSSDYEHVNIGSYYPSPWFTEPVYYYIQSARFQNSFLRIDGSNVMQFGVTGSGTVNCQYYDYSMAQTPSGDAWELLNIIYITPPTQVFT